MAAPFVLMRLNQYIVANCLPFMMRYCCGVRKEPVNFGKLSRLRLYCLRLRRSVVYTTYLFTCDFAKTDLWQGVALSAPCLRLF